MQTIMTPQEIDRSVAQLAQRLLDDPMLRGVPAGDIALVGIRSRGELLAGRLAREIHSQKSIDVLVGALDITMYRDDFARRGAVVIPRGTEMNFRLDSKVVVLIDDVLETGRSVRAALDAIADFGRPRMIKLLVLVDRGHREYPIAADYVGKRLDADPRHQVVVHLRPTDAQDGVYLELKQAPSI